MGITENMSLDNRKTNLINTEEGGEEGGCRGRRRDMLPSRRRGHSDLSLSVIFDLNPFLPLCVFLIACA